MKKIFNLICILTLLTIFIPINQTSAQENDKKIEVYVFTQQGCPFCAKTLALLENLKNTDFPNLIIHDYDLKSNPNYYKKFVQFASVYKVSTNTVPITFIDKMAIEGFEENTITSKIESCSLPVTNCINPDTYVQEQLPSIDQSASPIENQGKSTIGWIVSFVLLVGAGYLIYRKLN